MALGRPTEPEKDVFFVVDEIGPLEVMRGMGFEPFVSDLFVGERNAALRAQPNAHIVAVVRTSMVDKFVAKYAPGTAAVEFFTPECAIWRAFSAGVEPHFPFVAAP